MPRPVPSLRSRERQGDARPGKRIRRGHTATSRSPSSGSAVGCHPARPTRRRSKARCPALRPRHDVAEWVRARAASPSASGARLVRRSTPSLSSACRRARAGRRGRSVRLPLQPPHRRAGLAVLRRPSTLERLAQVAPRGPRMGHGARGVIRHVGGPGGRDLAVRASSVKVHRVACVVDCGTVINPDSFEAQMQGGIFHALNADAVGQLTFAAASPAQHELQQLSRDAHERDAAGDRADHPSTAPPSGVGEPGVPPVAPALANAYARLTGGRVRNLPFFPGATMSD